MLRAETTPLSAAGQIELFDTNVSDLVSERNGESPETTASNNYSQILKSSSIIGGAQVVSLLVGMVRTKFVAVLIGPLGVGLSGTFQAIQAMVGTVAGLGIQSSAVREIALAFETGDANTIGRMILTLRRVSWLTGSIGAFATVAGAGFLSQYTFGSSDYTLDIALLGLTILFMILQGAQMALIQGMRRIGDIARLNIVGTIIGSIVSVFLYAWLGLRGIIPALLSLSAIQLVVSWYFARKIPVPKVEMSWRESFQLAGGMFRLGLAIMWSGIMIAIVTYLTRAFIAHEISLEGVGIFTAAFALSGMFMDFVLRAMAADYYPQLTAFSHDRWAMNKLVNEQTEIGLLLAVPGLLATLTMAPWILRIFYSDAFLSAAAMMQWFVLGCLARVVSWPIGFVLLTYRNSSVFVITETICSILHLALIWGGLHVFGLEGVSIAFFVLNVMYCALIFLIARFLTGFAWSSATLQLFGTLFTVTALAFASGRMLSLWPSTCVGIIFTGSASMLSIRELVKRIGREHRIARWAVGVPGMRWVCGH